MIKSKKWSWNNQIYCQNAISMKNTLFPNIFIFTHTKWFPQQNMSESDFGASQNDSFSSPEIFLSFTSQSLSYLVV